MNQLEIGSQITPGVVPSTDSMKAINWNIIILIGIGILVLLIIQYKYEQAQISKLSDSV